MVGGSLAFPAHPHEAHPHEIAPRPAHAPGVHRAHG
jgi:hypothetical protein